MRQVRSIEEAAQVIRQLNDRLDRLESNNIDLHGRRIVNASKSVDSTDYVIQSELPVIPPSILEHTDYDPPMDKVKCTLGANQTVNPGVGYKVPFATEDFDIGGWHDNAVNNTRLTAPHDGYAFFSGQIYWSANATGSNRLCAILKNNTTYLAASQGPQCIAGASTIENCHMLMKVAKNDYFELIGVHDAGVAILIVADLTFFSAFYVE